MSPRVPSDVSALVDSETSVLVRGDRGVFCGPVYSPTGEIAIPNGYCLSDSEILVIQK